MVQSFEKDYSDNVSKNYEEMIECTPENGVHTNLVENLWIKMKQTLRRKYQRSTNHLDEYTGCVKSSVTHVWKPVFI